MTDERRFELLSLPGWSRAELLKMLFNLSEQPFEDQRITISDWKAYKYKMSLPQEARLPILRVEKSYSIVGTLEIARFISRQYGFYAESSIEESQIEEIIGYVETLHNSLLPIIRATLLRNTELRMFHWAQFKEDLLIPVLDFLTRRLAQNDYFISNRITLADVAVCELLSKFETLCEKGFLFAYPTLNAHRERVESLPQLKIYMSQRTRTFF